MPEPQCKPLMLVSRTRRQLGIDQKQLPIPHQTALAPNKINDPHKIYPTPRAHPYHALIPRTGGSQG